MGNHAQDTVRKRRRAFLGATSGHLIEWYDYGVYGFLAVYIGQVLFRLRSTPLPACWRASPRLP